jgi:hypothetical protein
VIVVAILKQESSHTLGIWKTQLRRAKPEIEMAWKSVATAPREMADGNFVATTWPRQVKFSN